MGTADLMIKTWKYGPKHYIVQVTLFATPCTVQSMKFFRPEYWSGQLFPSPGEVLYDF